VTQKKIYPQNSSVQGWRRVLFPQFHHQYFTVLLGPSLETGISKQTVQTLPIHLLRCVFGVDQDGR